MARTRTTKKLAQRIDLNYFKRPTPLKRAKFWLSLLLSLFALVWISWRGLSGDHRVYSSGRMSRAHAVLEKECAACHLQQAGTFSAKATDAACLDCHDGPVHHANAMKQLECAVCHAEHRGHISIVAASDQACAECHANLKTVIRVSANGPVIRETHIRNLEDSHPEFAVFQRVGERSAGDPGTIKLNHAIHMKAIRRGPNGPNVKLECGDCHRPPATQAVVYSNNSDPLVPPTNWTYADMQSLSAVPTYSEGDVTLPVPAVILPPYRSMTGRELMGPVRFAKACSGCHSLAFDKRFYEGVPHDKPEIIHAFLIKKFNEYIAAHPSELRETRDPGRDLTGKPLQPKTQVYTRNEWISMRLSDAEELLWRKTCKQCHELAFRSKQDNLPTVEHARTMVRWMPHAKFDHDAHRGFTCVSCHAKALTSTESSDILLPGIETCKTCHAPGPEHADSRCSECHTYHDWSKRKEVTPKFTLPALRTGGR